MFKNIVVSVDGSHPSSRALATAVDVAKRYEGRLTIVHAVMCDASLTALIETAERHGFMDQITDELDAATSVTPVPVPVTAAPLVALPENLLEKIGTLLLAACAAKARELGFAAPETALLDEDAALEVLAFAEANDVDLIVCGTRGLGNLRSFFLGSVSHKILEQAKCPCLLVK